MFFERGILFVELPLYELCEQPDERGDSTAGDQAASDEKSVCVLAEGHAESSGAKAHEGLRLSTFRLPKELLRMLHVTDRVFGNLQVLRLQEPDEIKRAVHIV